MPSLARHMDDHADLATAVGMVLTIGSLVVALAFGAPRGANAPLDTVRTAVEGPAPTVAHLDALERRMAVLDGREPWLVSWRETHPE